MIRKYVAKCCPSFPLFHMTKRVFCSVAACIHVNNVGIKNRTADTNAAVYIYANALSRFNTQIFLLGASGISVRLIKGQQSNINYCPPSRTSSRWLTGRQDFGKCCLRLETHYYHLFGPYKRSSV